jgi:hypothetical protein
VKGPFRIICYIKPDQIDVLAVIKVHNKFHPVSNTRIVFRVRPLLAMSTRRTGKRPVPTSWAPTRGDPTSSGYVRPVAKPSDSRFCRLFSPNPKRTRDIMKPLKRPELYVVQAYRKINEIH